MKLFVWDFHGTLEKGNENAVVEITNRVLEQNGFTERITLADVQRFYGRPWREYFIGILKNISPEQADDLQAQAVQYQRDNGDIVPKHVTANDHAAEVLAAIAAKHEQILISNLLLRDLEMFLDTVRLKKFFEPDRYFATFRSLLSFDTKQWVLQRYIERSGKQYEKIITIGDSPKDLIPVPNAVSYLYCHPGQTPREANSDYRIEDLREVLKEI